MIFNFTQLLNGILNYMIFFVQLSMQFQICNDFGCEDKWF